MTGLMYALAAVALVMLGAALGLLVGSLCVAAARADEQRVDELAEILGIGKSTEALS